MDNLTYSKVLTQAKTVDPKIVKLLLRGRTSPETLRTAINANFGQLPDGIWQVSAPLNRTDSCFFLLVKKGEHGCYFQQTTHKWNGKLMADAVEKLIVMNPDKDPVWQKAFHDAKSNAEGDFAHLVKLATPDAKPEEFTTVAAN